MVLLMPLQSAAAFAMKTARVLTVGGAGGQISVFIVPR
jgi:hypothetical protein